MTQLSNRSTELADDLESAAPQGASIVGQVAGDVLAKDESESPADRVPRFSN
jgi:hypothetical protein